MDTNEITTLFAAAGLSVELVAEATPATCPLCTTPDLVGFAEAA